jgi:hypothetical protein
MLISNRLEMGTINSLFKIVSLFRGLLADFARLHHFVSETVKTYGETTVLEIEKSWNKKGLTLIGLYIEISF